MNIAAQRERRANRVNLQLPVRIEAYQTETHIWREMTHLITVSPLGAGFYLKQQFPVGQLIYLTMPLPTAMRCYDHLEQSYNVWGLIRHCQPLSIFDSSAYHVGVAFVGKTPPASFKENPLQRYKLSDRRGDKFYEIMEDARPVFQKHPTRYQIPVSVCVTLLDAQGQPVAQEYTVTENISYRGAAIFSALQVNVGDRIQITNQQDNFTAFAVVRNRRIGPDNLPRLHLEFIDAQFPLQGIE